MKNLVNTFNTIVNGAKKFASEKGGIVLGAITLAALGGAVYCAIKDTSKVKEKKETEELRREEAGEPPMDIKDNVIFYAKNYWPTITCTTIAAAGIISYVMIGEKKIMELSTACSTASTIANQMAKKKEAYEAAIKENLSAEDAKKIEQSANAKISTITSTQPSMPLNNVIVTGTGNDIFKDAWSGRLFYSKGSYLKECVRQIEKSIKYDMYATLNEFYEEIGLETIDAGDLLVWDQFRGDTIELDFSQSYHDPILDTTVTLLNFYTKPQPRTAK